MSKKQSVTTLADAVEMAERAHAGQQRKGTRTPYIAHPLAVASLVLGHGGDTEQAIAALLHDVIEDGGASFTGEIEKQFGKRVLALVEACTDGTAEDKAKVKTPEAKRADWQERKRRYLERLKTESNDALLVTACDKLHNARAIVADLEKVGLAVFDRFTTGREGTLWYYDSTLEILRERGSSVAEPLAVALARMHELSESLGSGAGHDDAQTLLSDLLRRMRVNERANLRRLIARLEADAQHLVAESACAMSESSAMHQQLGNLLRQIDMEVREQCEITSFAATAEAAHIGELLRAIDDRSGSVVVSCALKLASLTLARPSELCRAEWAEIDMDAALWLIPAERMKGRIAHIVPLASQAVAILRELHSLIGRGQYVFPGAQNPRTPMPEAAIHAALRRMGFDKATMAGHGFRALASLRLNELGWSPDVIERQLVHADDNRVQYIEERTLMMQAWADYLDNLRSAQS